MGIFLKTFPRHLLTHALFNDIVNQQDRTYYFTAGRTKQWDQGPTSPFVEAETIDNINSVRSDMIVGVKVKPTDVAFVIAKNVWAYGTVYNNFCDDNKSAPYFIVNSNNDIYKCISNNNGAPSIAEPAARTVSGTFKTGDGYIWKYIATITPRHEEDFGTADRIPLIANNAVANSAVSGTIDAVSVVSVGTFYTKFSSGSVISQTSNTTLRIAGAADEGDNYYANTTLYISEGTGAGTLRTITSSTTANGAGNFITVNSNLTVDATSKYIISPRVEFVGDGVGAQAYAQVDAGGIANVTITSPGTNYTYSDVIINDTTGTPATLRAHVSPINGHGADVYQELLASSVAIIGEFPISLANTFPGDISYYQYALLESPRTSNNALATANTLIMSVKFNPSDKATTFTPGEYVKGQASDAAGKVFHSNSTATYLSYVSGEFLDNERVIGLKSGNQTFANNVTSFDYKINSGNILYYTNESAINRTDSFISEKIRCIFDLEG